MQTIFGDCAIESVGDRRRKAILLACVMLLLVIAAGAWFSYITHGIGYGDLFGISGRERDLAQLAFRAYAALGIALISEGSAFGIVGWLFLARIEPIWGRLCACVTFALFADFVTFSLVRP